MSVSDDGSPACASHRGTSTVDWVAGPSVWKYGCTDLISVQPGAMQNQQVSYRRDVLLMQELLPAARRAYCWRCICLLARQCHQQQQHVAFVTLHASFCAGP